MGQQRRTGSTGSQDSAAGKHYFDSIASRERLPYTFATGGSTSSPHHCMRCHNTSSPLVPQKQSDKLSDRGSEAYNLPPRSTVNPETSLSVIQPNRRRLHLCILDAPFARCDLLANLYCRTVSSPLWPVGRTHLFYLNMRRQGIIHTFQTKNVSVD